MRSAESLEWHRVELRRAAQDLMEGRLDIIAGTRHREPSGRLRTADDPDGFLIRRVDANMHDYPIGQTRALWEETALAERDRASRPYLQRISASVIDACRRLLEKTV